MKKTIFALLLLAGACQKKQENSAQNSVQSTEENKKVEQVALATKPENASSAENTAEKPKKFQNYQWYEGTIKDYPIWFYSDGQGAYYGYNSSKGANIRLFPLYGDNANQFTFQTSPGEKNAETFQGNPNSAGTIVGKWSNGKKNFDFQLNPVNYGNPRNPQEFLDFFADLKLPLVGSTIIEGDLLKNYYEEKKFGRRIENITNFVKDSNIRLASGEAILWGKIQSGENFLIIYQANLDPVEPITHSEAYTLQNDRMFFASLVDKNGKILATRILGNSPTDPYYLGFGFEIRKSNEITLLWTNYMRGDGGARMEAGVDKEVIRIRGNKFE